MVNDLHKSTSKSYSDNKVRVKDSTNTSTIIGDNNTITQNFSSTQPPVNVAPYEDAILGRIRFGKWLVFKLFHTYKHSMRGFAAVTSLFTILSGLPIGLFVFPRTNHLISPLVLSVGVVALSVAIYVGWGTIRWSLETKCPKCGESFRFLRTNKVLKASRNLSDKEVRNYTTTKTCGNPDCKYQEVRDETEEIPKDTD